MENYTRTDLACEWGECFEEKGVRQWEERFPGGKIRYLRIEDADAAKKIRRSMGEYVTAQISEISLLSKEETENIAKVLSRILARLLHEKIGREVDAATSVLVVGLGNRDITADALGPCSVDQLVVTRHLRQEEPALFQKMNCPAVSSLSPGVLGQTGMEVLDIIRGMCSRCHVDAVIALDSMAARSPDRLAATVQISTAGIEPGSGIGNNRNALNNETLGVPVIAMGVPTVVDSSTLVYDALRQAGIEQIDDRLYEILENGRRFYVSPKEADLINQKTALLLSSVLNLTFLGTSALT